MGAGDRHVGRDAERDRVASVLLDSAAGRPGALLVAGEAGVGKTSLLASVTGSPVAEDHLVLWGRCLRFGADSSPYLPIAQVLTHWHRQAEPAERERVLEGAGHLATIAPALGTPAGPADPGRIIPLVATVLDRVATARPLVVVVDDVQWADGTSLDLLAYLMAGFGTGQHLCLLVTYRDTGLGEGHRLHGWLADVLRLPSVSRLRLDRLGLADIEELVAGLDGGHRSAHHATEVFERSGGNPYLAELLARSPDQDPHLPHHDGLRQALLGSWHRLDPGARELLQLLAVGGRPVAVPVLSRLVATRGRDPAAVDTWLAQAHAESLVTLDPEGQAWFHHPLVAEVVAATLTPSERVDIHREYVAALEPGEELSAASRAALLALHHHGGRHPDQAFTWSLRAADAAAGVLAFAEEFDHLHRACRLWDEVDDATRTLAGPGTALLVRASESAWRAGQHLLAVELRERAIALVDPDADPVLAVRLRLRLHHRRVVCGLESGPDVATNRRIVELASRCPGTVELCIALAQLAFAKRWAGDPTAETDADAAVRLARDLGSAEALAWAIGVRSQTRSDFTTGLVDAERSVDLARDVGDPELLGNAAVWRANCLIGLGLLQETAESLLAVFHELVAAGSLYDAMWAHPGWAASVLTELGRWDEARAVLRELLSHRLAADPVGSVRGAAALLAFRSGDREAGRTHLERAHELLPLQRRVTGELLSWMELLVHVECRESEKALEQITATMPVMTAIDPDSASEMLVPAARTAGDLAELPGRRAEAIARLDRIEQLRGLDVPWFDALGADDQVHPARAALFAAGRARCHGDPDEAGLWEAAVAACARAGMVWDRALASYHLARALLPERGSRSRAAAALREAHRIATDLGAEPIRADVEALARQARIPLTDPEPPSGPDSAPSALTTLTHREQEVLSHVVAGRTYAEIAAALFISEKTVSVHVSNLLRKTGTSSRIELADLARRADHGTHA